MKQELTLLFVYAYFIQFVSFNLIIPLIGLAYFKIICGIEFTKNNYFIISIAKTLSSIIALIVIVLIGYTLKDYQFINYYLKNCNLINYLCFTEYIRYTTIYLIILLPISLIGEYIFFKKYLFSSYKGNKIILFHSLFQVVSIILLLIYYYTFHVLYYLWKSFHRTTKHNRSAPRSLRLAAVLGLALIPPAAARFWGS